MALRRIVGIIRGGRGNIVQVCVEGIDGPLPVGTIIGDIDASRHRYVVHVGARPTPVFVAMDRRTGRRFLVTGADPQTAGTLDVLPACPNGRTRVQHFPVRRDVATVGDAERARLRDAILALNRRWLTPTDRVSVWFKQDQIHQATHVHGEPGFLPWHRVLVNEFERQLQELDPTLALHYWDWTADPRRAPNGNGGVVDLMQAGFIGASNGPIGSPFFEADFYRPSPPNREQPGPGRFAPDPALPPGQVARRVLTSGRGPREVTLADVPELYEGDPEKNRPRSEDLIRIRSDETLVDAGLHQARGGQFDAMWQAIYLDHGLAHRYIGGNIGGFGRGQDLAHRSFEDPFVFLLHSNVDRLWASWQLSARGFNAWEEPCWRVEPASYGDLVSHPDLTAPMRPWGPQRPGQPGVIEPWDRPDAYRLIRGIDREVLRPPLYDRYTFPDNLCATWTTLLGGHRLSTHDVVRLTVELDAVSHDQVQFVLRTGPEVWWWKALRLPDWTMIETESANAEVRAFYSIAGLDGGQLIFHKAQGVIFPGRRIVFRIADLQWIQPGSRLTFTWEDD